MLTFFRGFAQRTSTGNQVYRGRPELDITTIHLVMSRHPLASTKFGNWIPDIDTFSFLEYVEPRVREDPTKTVLMRKGQNSDST